MIPSSRHLLSRPVREIVRREISKTGSNTNQGAGNARQKLEQLSEVGRSNKWVRTNILNNNRALSTIMEAQREPSLGRGPPLVTKEESREFMALFPDLVRDLTDAGRHQDVPDATRHYARALQANVPTGKRLRGLSVVASYKQLERPERLTGEAIRRAMVLGWCVEMLQATFLIMDDIMDNSEMRRGVPCWYKRVGMDAINDALLIEHGIYSLLRRHFSQHPCYLPVLELFHDVTLKTSMGQALDVMTMVNGRPNLDVFTMDRYNSIVKYKTAYYTFQLPVSLAMYLSNMFHEEQHRQAKTILLEMGHFFQVQDDFLDCFGDFTETGKGNTDIQEGKCSWLAVVALQRASESQRRLMREHYGRKEAESVAIVRRLYEELGLPATYATYEEETDNLIRTHVQQISKGLPHELFFRIMDRLYRRQS